MRIEIVRVADLHSENYFEQIATLHIEQIQQGFLSKLGCNFLKALYKCIATSRYSFLYVALYEAEVVGFICGCTNTKKLYIDFSCRYGFRIFPLLLPSIGNVNNVKRVIETLLYPQKQVMTKLPKSEILNFCVSKQMQRKGIGKRLFYELAQDFRRRHITSIKMVTGNNQLSARYFYEALGARLVKGIEIHQGVNSLVYLYDLAGKSCYETSF